MGALRACLETTMPNAGMADVAHALVRAVSRLISTLVCEEDRASARVPTRHARVRAPRSRQALRFIRPVPALVLATALCLAAPVRVSRSMLAVLERGFDERIERFSIDDPLYLLGSTRGVYLEKYGAVFTAELNLVTGPAITPFRPKLTKEEVDKLRQKKLTRLPEVRQLMRDMMVTSATALSAVPPEEQIVVGVSLFYYSWENGAGLPGQIVMQAKRKTLVDYEAGRVDLKTLTASIQEQVF